MTTEELKAKITELKKEKDVCILAHSYQRHEILEVADFTGDSYALSKKAATVPNKTVLMCGVRFMAETVKLLSPEKTVILSQPDATCPMAEQITPEKVAELRKKYPEHKIVAYINTTSALKAVCDVCVTSASAPKIIAAMPEDKIIFVPDRNLGSYIKKNFPEKDIVLMDGCCPIHSACTVDAVKKVKAAHPGALFLVHPECTPEVAALADFIGSTSGIMNYAKESTAKEFIIGTENSIVTHLQYECPDKKFYAAWKDFICADMQLTTLPDVYNCLIGEGGEVIELPAETAEKAKACIDKMIAYGG